MHAGKLQAEQADRVDAGNAFGAVGEVDRAVEIAHQNTHDLAETERDDRQIVAAQPQRRRAEQNAARRRQQGRQRDQPQHRQVQPIGEPLQQQGNCCVRCGDDSSAAR